MLAVQTFISNSSSIENHIRSWAPENVTMSRIKNWEELALKGSRFAQKRGRRKSRKRGRRKTRKRGRGQKRRKAKKKNEKKSFKRVAPVDKQAV